MYILLGHKSAGNQLAGLGQTKVVETHSQSSTSALTLAVPKMVKVAETSPSFSTLYVGIDLNPVWENRKIDGKWKQTRAYASPMTGIFIPKTYIPRSTVNLILYLHGFKAPCGLDEKATINQYWSQGYFKWLREAVNDSGQNVILVAPTLGPRSGAGKLIQSGGFNAFIDQVLAALNAYNPLNKIPFINRFTRNQSIGNIILACHSGGGKPMRAIASLNPSTDSYAAQIKECWGFDCLYSGDDANAWRTWASAHPQSKLFVYYKNSTHRQSEQLRDQRPHLSNVFVQKSNAKNHCSVPSHHWKERLVNIS